MEGPIVSVVTVVFNNHNTIADTIDSILNQSYQKIEYIIIDGGSTDGTIDIINSYGNRISKFISEPDDGMYDALNKGIQLASGEIIGLLNSDDFFCDNFVIEKIVKSFSENEIESVFGDVQYVDPDNINKVVRYYSSKFFRISKFRLGFMPAHPSFYAKRDLFSKYGLYKKNYKIAADFELVMRFLLINRVSFKYIEMPFVSMRTGGISNKSLRSNILLNIEIMRACRENGITTNYLLIYSKYFFKISQLLFRKGI